MNFTDHRASQPHAGQASGDVTPYGDLADLPTGHPGRRAVEIAAAGGHHLALSGPGRLLIAENLHAMLPDLDPATAGEVSALHQHAGLHLPPGRSGVDVRVRPPWQAPHHTMSIAMLIGTRRHPGMVSLAHAGVLYLDQAPDVPPAAVNALRPVLDEGQVRLGPGPLVAYPARIQLVLGSTGCPEADLDCTCTCTPTRRRRYHARLAVLIDRVDLRVTLPPLDRAAAAGEATATIAQRVATARQRAEARWRHLNTQATHPAAGGVSNATAAPDPVGLALRAIPRRLLGPLDRAVAVGSLSGRGAVRILRLAFTVADLAGHDTPDADDLAEALGLRTQPF